MASKEKLIFDVTPAEKAWFEELVQASDQTTKIGLLRALLDEYAKKIKFKPRPE
jgi:hypothetical protein